MSKTRAIFLPIVIAIAAMLASLPSAGAAPFLGTMVAPSLLNLTPGSSLTFTVTVDVPAADPPDLTSNVGVIVGGLDPDFSAVSPLTPGTSIVFSVSVPTDKLITACVGGSVTYMYYLTTGGESQSATAPCSIATSVIEVEPILPGPPTAVCGRNNDIVTIPDQPPGVLVAPGSDVWFEATLTVEFVPAVGYTLIGTTSITFIDEVIPCLAVPIDPVQTEVCGPNNDEILIPEQPDNVILAGTTDWEDGIRSVSFVPADAYEFDWSGWYDFTDVNTPCPVDPSPTSAPLPTAVPLPPDVPAIEPTAAPPSVPPVTSVNPPAVTGSSPQPAMVTALPSTGTGSSASSVYLALTLGLIGLTGIGIGLRQSRRI